MTTLLNKWILVAGVLVFVQAEPPGGRGGGSHGVPSQGQGGSGGYNQGGGGGNGGGYKQESYPPRPYNFAYAVNDHYSGANFGQMEKSDGQVTNGEYRVLLPDGRLQIVTYVADWKNGFNADVKYQGEAKYPDPPKGGYGGSSSGSGYSAPSGGSGTGSGSAYGAPSGGGGGGGYSG